MIAVIGWIHQLAFRKWLINNSCCWWCYLGERQSLFPLSYYPCFPTFPPVLLQGLHTGKRDDPVGSAKGQSFGSSEGRKLTAYLLMLQLWVCEIYPLRFWRETFSQYGGNSLEKLEEQSCLPSLGDFDENFLLFCIRVNYLSHLDLWQQIKVNLLYFVWNFSIHPGFSTLLGKNLPRMFLGLEGPT